MTWLCHQTRYYIGFMRRLYLYHYSIHCFKNTVATIHRWPVNSPHKGPVKRKMFPLDDVIMIGKCTGHLTLGIDNKETIAYNGYTRWPNTLCHKTFRLYYNIKTVFPGIKIHCKISRSLDRLACMMGISLMIRCSERAHKITLIIFHNRNIV